MADSNKPNPDRKRPDSDGNDGGNQNPNNRPPGSFLSRTLMGWMLLIGLAFLLLFLMASATHSPDAVTVQAFMAHAEQKQFKEPVVVHDDRMVGVLKDDAVGTEAGAAKRVMAKISLQTKEGYVRDLTALGQEFTEDPGNSVWFNMLVNYGPFIVLLLLIYFFVFRTFRGAGGGGGMLGNFGRSKHKMMTKEHSTVSLNDVAGIQEAKDEVGEIIEFLKNPKKFQRLGGRVPRGVLLIGSPGCGKTLLAKAVAGEADVPFFSISGSDFVEMFVGVGASRVRDLFKQAKENSPCIIFLDEIDAVGRRRGSGFSSGGHDEREQTLNAILVEMDGFDTNDQVIVVAATNRADVLDPALTRPGRFDRQITVPLPDLLGRVEILKVHSRKIKMGPDADLEKLARGTPMFSGAELAAVINEAAIGATLQNKDFVEQADLDEARDKVRFGRARKSHRVQEKERIATAYHEAGHAVLQYLLEDADPLHKVTIIPRGNFGGATFALPEDDRVGYGRRFVTATMRVLCAGRIAEQRKTDDVTSGASMDIRMATRYARHMVVEWGMSGKLGFVDYGPNDSPELMAPERSHSDETARVIDEEIRVLIDDAFSDAERMINDNWEKVEAVAEALLRYETLSVDEVDRIMKGDKLTKPTVGDLLKAEHEKDRQEQTPPPQPEEQHDGEAPGAMPSPA